MNSDLSSNALGFVSIDRIDNLYNKVILDFTKGSHFDVGQTYAQKIVDMAPGYGGAIDKFLAISMAGSPEHPNLSTVIERAKDLLANMPSSYAGEIAGMSTVFNYPIDQLGDGKLSANELLVFEVVHDVLDPGSCSGAAAFGQSTDSGATIVGRNFDWYAMPGASELQTVQLYKNSDGAANTVGIGLLGQLFPASMFNENHLSGALLDSDMKQPYFSTIGADSYPVDLRFAMEHFSSIQGAAAYIEAKPATHSFITLLADRISAAVLENDLEHPEARGLRYSDSPLREGATWDFTNSLAVVNSFLLPGTTDDFTGVPENEKRFDSFKSLFGDKLASGGTISLGDMQDIVSYTGTDGIAQSSGAIYRAINDYPTYLSYVQDMNTLHIWASFGPTPGNPPNPSYVQVFAGSPF